MIKYNNSMYTTIVPDEPYYEGYYDYLYDEWERSNEIDTDYYYNEFCYNQNFTDNEDEYVRHLIDSDANPYNQKLNGSEI